MAASAATAPPARKLRSRQAEHLGLGTIFVGSAKLILRPSCIDMSMAMAAATEVGSIGCSPATFSRDMADVTSLDDAAMVAMRESVRGMVSHRDLRLVSVTNSRVFRQLLKTYFLQHTEDTSVNICFCGRLTQKL